MTAPRVVFDEAAYRRALDERAAKTIGRPLSHNGDGADTYARVH